MYSDMRPDTFEPFSEVAEHDAGPRKLIWPLVLLLVIGAGIAGWKVAGPFDGWTLGGDGWVHDLDDGLDAAYASGKPAFVLFTADWCPPCQELKRTVLHDPDTLAALEESFVLVKVDLTSRFGPNTEVASEFGVRGIPAAIVFDSDGYETDRVVGGSSLASWIYANAQ